MAAATDLDAWLANQLADLYAAPPTDTPGMLLAAAVWGEPYIDRLARYSVPTLLTPENLEALHRFNTKVLLLTTKQDYLRLWRATMPIERAGLPLQFAYVPQELLTGPDPSHKFQALGTLQALMLQKAAREGRGLHMYMPDHVYDRRYFATLASLVEHHEAIAHGAVSVSIETAAAELEAHREGRFIAIPGRTLGDIGWRHLHPQTRAVLLNGVGTGGLPRSHAMLWQGRDALHLAGPFGNPAWIGPRLCRMAPVVAPTTLDAELPHLMPDGFYIPTPADEMVCVELSDAGKVAPKVAGPEDFTSVSWIQMNFDDAYLPVTRRRTLIPIEPREDGMNEAAIQEHHDALVDLLVRSKYAAMERFLRYLGTVNRRFRRVL